MTERTRYHLSRFDGIAIAWMTLVAAFAIWQTAAFEGVIHRLGDWQFAHVARYFPTATALLVIAVLLLPGLALVWWARRHEKRDLSPRELLDLRSRRLLRTLKTFAIALAVGAAGLLLATLFLPRESGRQPSVVTAAETRPPSGPVMLVGRLKLDRVMLYRQRMGFASRAYYFAPVEPVGDKQLRYFVELPGDIRNGDPGRYRGVISRDMPRPASALYPTFPK